MAAAPLGRHGVDPTMAVTSEPEVTAIGFGRISCPTSGLLLRTPDGDFSRIRREPSGSHEGQQRSQWRHRVELLGSLPSVGNPWFGDALADQRYRLG